MRFFQPQIPSQFQTGMSVPSWIISLSLSSPSSDNPLSHPVQFITLHCKSKGSLKYGPKYPLSDPIISLIPYTCQPNWPTPFVSRSPILIWATDYPHPEMACLQPITLDFTQKVEKQCPLIILYQLCRQWTSSTKNGGDFSGLLGKARCRTLDNAIVCVYIYVLREIGTCEGNLVHYFVFCVFSPDASF